MSLYKELDHTDKVREITGVQFSVMSPEEIKNMGFKYYSLGRNLD